jgi:hypothetical protein
MEKITSAAGLKNAILLLEDDQAMQGQLLKEQFQFTYERFKPVNLIKSTIKDLASSPYLIDNILATAIGLATGFLSKKIFVGSSGNLFRKLLGYFLQAGVTNTVSKHPEAIKSFGQLIFQYLFHRRKMNSEQQ